MNRQELVITRRFEAPRDILWAAFTEPERMSAWWGPPGSTVTHAQMDLRPGGRYHFRSTFSDGNEIWGLFRYLEISPPERLVYLHSFSDKDGAVAASPFDGPWPARLHTTLSFIDAGGGTTLSLHQYPIDARSEEEAAYAALIEDMINGWGGTFDRLVHLLRGSPA